jgi:hypothetical protein
MQALDLETQLSEMKAIAGQPDYALGSVHAITREGTLVIASASRGQLASYAWGATNVIFVVGAQKLVPSSSPDHQIKARVRTWPDDTQPPAGWVTFDRRSRVSIQAAPTAGWRAATEAHRPLETGNRKFTLG